MPKFIISILIPLIIGALSGYFTSSGVNGWYAGIQKPWFNPPNGIFAPVWTTLYILMGISFYLVWKKEEKTNLWKQALMLFGLQLFLNFTWSIVFFYFEQPGWAFLNILLLWAAILSCIIWFARFSAIAEWLMVPYLCWVSFAAVLNFSIWRLN